MLGGCDPAVRHEHAGETWTLSLAVVFEALWQSCSTAPGAQQRNPFIFYVIILLFFYVGFYIMLLFGLSLNDVDVASWRIMVGCRPTNPHWTRLARPVRSREHSWRLQIRLHLFLHLVGSHKVFDGPPVLGP